jgi:dTDP-4-dehydrorhamnose 3,5-epimerase
VIFTETPLRGAFVIEPERREDLRGFFARTWCRQEAEAHGLDPRVVQCSISSNKRKGTLRGLHYQRPPFAEAKLVHCTRGVMFDVILDLRTASPTYKRYFGLTLSAENHTMLYIPEGFAHGFQTLADDTEVLYQMSQVYAPDSAAGIRWNDPAFDIPWPEEVRTLSDRDRTYPDFTG